MLLVFGMFSYFTLFMEICFPFLVWTRIRPFMIGLAIFLHAGIAIIMGLTCFQLLMLALIMCFFPASVVRSRLFWEPGTGPKMTLRYNGRNPVHGRLVTFLRAFDLTGQIACRDEPGKVNAVELIGVDGRVHTGYDIVEHAFAHLLFVRTIRWLLYVPGVPQLIRSFTGVNGGTEVAKRADAAPSAAKTTTAR
jgi:hypothetical protein